MDPKKKLKLGFLNFIKEVVKKLCDTVGLISSKMKVSKLRPLYSVGLKRIAVAIIQRVV